VLSASKPCALTGVSTASVDGVDDAECLVWC